MKIKKKIAKCEVLDRNTKEFSIVNMVYHTDKILKEDLSKKDKILVSFEVNIAELNISDDTIINEYEKIKQSKGE